MSGTGGAGAGSSIGSTTGSTSSPGFDLARQHHRLQRRRHLAVTLAQHHRPSRAVTRQRLASITTSPANPTGCGGGRRRHRRHAPSGFALLAPAIKEA